MHDIYAGDDMRRLEVLVRHLPPDSATGRALGRFTRTEVLLMDLWLALTRDVHPEHPFAQHKQSVADSKAARLVEQRERARRMKEAQNG
ncbi:MAG: hypothetical protein ACXWDJ_10575 [Aeromicrobium sp.]